jgi:short-subunit dehydrogenase
MIDSTEGMKVMMTNRFGAALVTGASSGIGWELARQLASQGYAVGLVARREAPLRELESHIASSGGRAVVAVADVGACEQVEAAVKRVRASLGPIDLVIANAGVGKATFLDPVNIVDVEEMVRINLLGVVYTLSAALPDMLARRKGHLVAISSLAGYRGLPGESAYCASKAAVNTYMDGLRIHLRGTGVTVTTVCPGFVQTPMTAKTDPVHMPQLMDAPTAARRILRAIAAGRKVYNFPWRLTMLVKLSRWLPDRVLNWAMGDYNAEALQHAKPPVP